MKEVVLWNVSLDEITEVYESLTLGKRYVDNPLHSRGRLEFVAGVRVDGIIAGIGGINRRLGFLPFVFYIVKPEFRRRGLSGELTKMIITYIKQRHGSYILSSSRIDNTNSLKVHKKYGYREVYKSINYYKLCYPVNIRGEILCRIMPLLYKIYFFLNRLRGKRW
jgi:ribosomal protein S18 acetylase RimI-like enzyme